MDKVKTVAKIINPVPIPSKQTVEFVKEAVTQPKETHEKAKETYQEVFQLQKES